MNVTGQIKKLLFMNASSMIIFNYIGIFVNLYIWEKQKSIFDVTWFNLVMFISWSLAFAVGSRLLSKFSTRLLIRTTAICGGLTFALLSFLQLENRLLWIACIAVPIGIMWGFYASTQNITLCVFGKGKDFEGYFSIASIIGQLVSIINPIAFAFIIKWIGYSGSFLLMILFVGILLAVSFYIPRSRWPRRKSPCSGICGFMRCSPLAPFAGWFRPAYPRASSCSFKVYLRLYSHSRYPETSL
ncbi:hypothetical protein LJK88_31420 [Paenibacillus sp. P26]|nr:hypothetical protein LJK88_31420 [Paenibacillus sp. P26]